MGPFWESRPHYDGGIPKVLRRMLFLSKNVRQGPADDEGVSTFVEWVQREHLDGEAVGEKQADTLLTIAQLMYHIHRGGLGSFLSVQHVERKKSSPSPSLE